MCAQPNHMYTWKPAYSHKNMHTYANARVHQRTHKQIHANMPRYTLTCVYTRVYAPHTRTLTHTYTNTHLHTPTHTHIHTHPAHYTHTHTHTRVWVTHIFACVICDAIFTCISTHTHANVHVHAFLSLTLCCFLTFIWYTCNHVRFYVICTHTEYIFKLTVFIQVSG